MDIDLPHWEAALLARAPVFSLAIDYPAGTDVPRHRHGVGQVLHTTGGVLLAETPGRAWAIPPGRALWLPPATPHQFRTIGATSLRTLYLAPHAGQAMPAAPQVLHINALVRELIVASAKDGAHGTSPRVQTLLMPLLLAELQEADRDGLSVPMPTSANLLAFTQRAMAQPTAAIARIAADLGLSEKTLGRRFVRETGLTPDRWRRHATLLASLAHLQTGRSVTDIAHTAGYNSSASFAAAFKACFGVTPSQARS